MASKASLSIINKENVPNFVKMVLYDSSESDVKQVTQKAVQDMSAFSSKLLSCMLSNSANAWNIKNKNIKKMDDALFKISVINHGKMCMKDIQDDYSEELYTGKKITSVKSFLDTIKGKLSKSPIEADYRRQKNYIEAQCSTMKTNLKNAYAARDWKSISELNIPYKNACIPNTGFIENEANDDFRIDKEKAITLCDAMSAEIEYTFKNIASQCPNYDTSGSMLFPKKDITEKVDKAHLEMRSCIENYIDLMNSKLPFKLNDPEREVVKAYSFVCGKKQFEVPPQMQV